MPYNDEEITITMTRGEWNSLNELMHHAIWDSGWQTPKAYNLFSASLLDEEE